MRERTSAAIRARRRLAGFSLLVAVLAVAGCGSSGTANQVAVSVIGTASILVPTQSETITATVTGATDQTVTFTCEFFTTANPTTADPNPKQADKGACTSDVGTLSNQNISSTASSTVTFTAPAKFPDQTTLPNVEVHVIATSKANPKKSNFFRIAFDSGIRLVLSPSTATLATGEQTTFQALDFNNNPVDPTTLTWGVTFETVAKVDSVSCSGGSNDCGSVKTSGSTEVYTAPASVPKASTVTTPAQNAAGIVTLFAFSNVDNARIAQSTITLVQAGPITFNGVSPTVVPQGAFQADIFLNASNVTSQIGVSLTGPCANGGTAAVAPTQLKVVFPAGSASSALGARVRLTAAQLAQAGACQISISSGGPNISVTGGPFTFNVVPVRPSLVGLSSPTPGTIPAFENLSEATFRSQGPTVDGGYFGPSASQITVNFDGQTLTTPGTPTPRRFPSIDLSQVSISGHAAGLFPLSISNPLLSSTAAGFTNIAIIPDYTASNPPLSAGGAALAGAGVPGTYNGPAPILLGASVVPSAVAIDSPLRLAVVTDANPADANNVQILSLGASSTSNTPPAVVGTASSGGTVATSVAIDDRAHIAAIVNYASRTLSLLNLQTSTLITPPIDLSNNNSLIPGATTQPFPYAVGVDPFLHRAVVAFASTNIGLLVNYDPAAPVTCIPNPLTTAPFCPIGFVTLSTGSHPQVAFEAGAHLAYVTPGGGGSLAGVDLSVTSAPPVAISSLQRVANVVTVTTAVPHNLNASLPGTVLISGSQVGSFVGSFPVLSVTGASSFTYAQTGSSETVTCAGDVASCGVTEGAAPREFLISPTIQGIGVNPVTRRLVLADSNVTSGQIDFLNPLNQSLTSMTLFKGGVGTVTNGAPELGEAGAGFQPFTNTAVIFNSNANFNQISLIDPTQRQRLAIINTGQTGTGTACVSGCGGASPVSLTIPGALAVDSVTNQAIAANSGSGSLTVIALGAIRPIHVQEVRTPVVPGAPLLQRAILVPSDPNLGPQPVDVPGVDIFGTGFDAGSVVRLDGTPLPAGDVNFVSSTHIVATIPASALTGLPRRFNLDVVSSGGVVSNANDLSAIVTIGLPNCGTANPPATAPAPGGVAIDDQRGIALVTETACNVLAKINLNSGQGFAVVSTMPTGQNPTGVAVIPSLTATLGVAVVTNHAANTVSILDLDHGTQVVSDVAVGTSPNGVAANPQTKFVLVANSGSNSATGIDLTPLTASPIGTLAPTTVATDQNPIAVAIDPDRGSNSRGLAAVTALSLSAGTSPIGAIDAIDIGGAVPVRSAIATSASFLNATPNDITFDPIAPTGTANPGLFYAVTSQSNQFVNYNPDNGAANPVSVGINPTSVAANPQTGTILTVNAISNSMSIIDSQISVTRATIGIGASGPFAAAISQIKNFAVISDQTSNRVMLFPLP